MYSIKASLLLFLELTFLAIGLLTHFFPKTCENKACFPKESSRFQFY